MYINIALLEKYFKENGYEVNTNIDINSSEPNLKFVLGNDKDGSRVEFLDFESMYQILVVDEIFGVDGLVKEELELVRKNLRLGKGDMHDGSDKIEILIYDTLAKYIIQMFNAGTGKILFSHITPLPNHKSIYFRKE